MVRVEEERKELLERSVKFQNQSVDESIIPENAFIEGHYNLNELIWPDPDPVVNVSKVCMLIFFNLYLRGYALNRYRVFHMFWATFLGFTTRKASQNI